jgi:3-hydroxy-3-methylglutaryl CoA synthase
MRWDACVVGQYVNETVGFTEPPLPTLGITSYGAYIPKRRLRREAIASAVGWLTPGLASGTTGARAMASWDEDPITMAVEAGRDCLPEPAPSGRRAGPAAVFVGSTTMPFADRQNAGVVAAALNLPQDASAVDIGGSQRAGLSALLAGLDAVASGRVPSALVVASEKRRARVGSGRELQYGDAAAAVTLGRTNVVAAWLGSAAISVDFVDHVRAVERRFDYHWEDRWVRDEGFLKVIPDAVRKLLADTNTAGDEISQFILPCQFRGLDRQVATQCGIPESSVRDNLSATVGEAGTAHALLMLVHALESAEPGDRILAVQFGQGCVAMLFEVTSEVGTPRPRQGVSDAIAAGIDEPNYLRYLAFNGLIDLEKGMRAEGDLKSSFSTHHRNSPMLTALVGGKCRRCDTAQFPLSRICVDETCHAIDSQDPHGFAEQKGRVLSCSADYLAYSVDPPSQYGMITFAGGGRFMADLTDVEQGRAITPGDAVRMVFRLKSIDELRGFRRYFWKATPLLPLHPER